MSDYKFGTWYPIESAPKDRRILLCLGGKIWSGGSWNDRDYRSGAWEDDGFEPVTFIVQPSHWMPPPSPPVEELTLFPDSVPLVAPVKSNDWPGFNAFWGAYPNKQAKKPALKAWNREKPEIQQVAKALAWQTESEQWQKGFIPLPTTYLNQRRWEDEQPETEKPVQVYQ